MKTDGSQKGVPKKEDKHCKVTERARFGPTRLMFGHRDGH